MANVKFSHVGKVYEKDEYIVKDFNLEIEDGEIVTLIGPSGSGKSTVLRMLAGLERITTGEIYIDGKLVNDIEAKDRGISMVFQNYALFPNMTGRENMEFALKMQKVKKRERNRRSDEMAEILGVTHLMDKKAKGFSGGECQRISLGRSLVCKPKVLLLDEPLSNIDAKAKVSLRTLISEVQEKFNITTLYVTHDQVEAMTMGDRIAIIKDGFIEQVDTPINTFLRPKSVFVAEFLGDIPMNILKTNLMNDTKGYFIILNKEKIYLPKRKSISLDKKEKTYDEVYVGIRDQDIIFTETEEIGKNEITLDVNVTAVEVLGSIMNVILDINGFSIKTQVAINEKIQPDSILKVNIDVNKLYFFDGDTKEAIDF